MPLARGLLIVQVQEKFLLIFWMATTMMVWWQEVKTVKFKVASKERPELG